MTATTKPEQMELFQTLFGSYGHVYMSKPDTRGATHMAAHVNMSMSFLLDREDNIPEWILADDEIFFTFFAGYTDAEAHIGVHNGYAVFKLDTNDKNIISQSYEMLQKAGITGPKPFICAEQGYTNKNGHPYHYELWRLQISSKSSLLNLFERIEPYLKHKKRIQDMQAAIQNVQDRNSGKPPRTLRKMNHAKDEQR
jgi:LAGLIDADG DNA endonuclease family protein